MKEQSKIGSVEQTRNTLLELGFEEQSIKRALQITTDVEIASQIALKLADEGPNADLSQYLPIPKPVQEVPIGMFSRAKMLFVVNGQLKMGKGKVCAQVGHAVIGGFLQTSEDAQIDPKVKRRLDSWNMVGTPKVVVRTDTEKEMMEIRGKLKALGINQYLVEDAGHTQIKAGSKTVLAVGPAFPEEIDPITKHLKLL